MPQKPLNLAQFPKVQLCHQPTPIEKLSRLTEHLAGANLFIKRDDCTGLATGGNKTRKLEFLVGEAIQQGADILVTQGAVQSNHVRQTAAAACKHGIQCHALLERRVPNKQKNYEESGNVLLDKLFGCTVEFRQAGLDMNAEAMLVVQELKTKGKKPYFIPGGGSNDVGALGYVSCAMEIEKQAKEMNTTFDWVVLGTGSAGTQAGLVAGLDAIGSSIATMGVSVRHPQAKQIDVVHSLAVKVSQKLAHELVAKNKIIVNDEYVGEGYGIPAPSTLDAIHSLAKFEGILLDPVYSGKGFAGFIGLVKNGFFKPNENILFLHTGGASSLFVYEEELS